MSTIEVVGSFLDSLCESNEQQCYADTDPTVFDAEQSPEITPSGYLNLLQKGFKCSHECSVMAVIYLQSSGIIVCQRNVHRLLLGCLLLAAKVREDFYYSNLYYAHTGGVELSEITRIEGSLLTLLDWDLGVDRELYDMKLLQLTSSQSRSPSIASSSYFSACSDFSLSVTSTPMDFESPPCTPSSSCVDFDLMGEYYSPPFEPIDTLQDSPRRRKSSLSVTVANYILKCFCVGGR